MLKKWAIGDEEKNKPEPDTSLKLLTVMNEDLDEADLKAVLLECLREAPQDQEEDDANNVRRCMRMQFTDTHTALTHAAACPACKRMTVPIGKLRQLLSEQFACVHLRKVEKS